MTMDTWFAFIATVMLIVLLPGPLAYQTASYAVQRGRRTAAATVPAVAAGLSVAMLAAAIPVGVVATFAPALMASLAWAGLAYLLLYAIWSYQDPSVAGPLADNDNLPETGMARIFGSLFARTLFTPRYVVAMAAVSAQFVDTNRQLLPQAIDMNFGVVIAAALASGCNTVFTRRILGRKRIKSARNLLASRFGTRFISSRAVSAGYRRIAA